MSSVLRDVLGQVFVMLRNVAPHPAHVGKRRFHTRDNMRRGYEVQQRPMTHCDCGPCHTAGSEDQVRQCQAVLAGKGWSFVRTYEDRALAVA